MSPKEGGREGRKEGARNHPSILLQRRWRLRSLVCSNCLLIRILLRRPSSSAPFHLMSERTSGVKRRSRLDGAIDRVKRSFMRPVSSLPHTKYRLLLVQHVSNFTQHSNCILPPEDFNDHVKPCHIILNLGTMTTAPFLPIRVFRPRPPPYPAPVSCRLLD